MATSPSSRARANKRTKLSPKERAFVFEYLVDHNKALAAIRAGYSARSAKEIGYELALRPVVKAAIKKALAQQQARTLITADQVLHDIKDMGDEARTAGEYTAALRSRHLLGLHLKLFSEKVELTGPNGGPMEFTEVRRTIVDPAKP